MDTFKDLERFNLNRGVTQQRSLMVVALTETRHLVRVAESLRRQAGSFGSTFAFWSGVSCPPFPVAPEHRVCMSVRASVHAIIVCGAICCLHSAALLCLADQHGPAFD